MPIFNLIDFLRRVTRTTVGRKILARVINSMSFALPVKRFKENEMLLVFHHPGPQYKTHILLVPKKDILDLNALAKDDDQLILKVFRMVKLLVEEFDLTDYSLIVNAGDYQKVPQLHFHRVSDS